MDITFDREAWEIAAYARRFALLARRREFASDSREVRAFHALTEDAPGALHLFDAASVVGASETDRVCARVAAILDSGIRPSPQLLDVLDAFPFTRLAAIYFSVGEPARRRLCAAAAWPGRAEALADRIATAAATLDDLIDTTPTTPLGHELARTAIESDA